MHESLRTGNKCCSLWKKAGCSEDSNYEIRETGVARRLADIHAIAEVSKHLEKLIALNPFLLNGVWVTQGWMRNGLPVALQISKLQILMPAVGRTRNDVCSLHGS